MSEDVRPKLLVMRKDFILFVPWFWASLSSLNCVTCWWSLVSFGLWQPCLPNDVGDWEEEELSVDRPRRQQEEDEVSFSLPGVKSSLLFSIEVSQLDGNVTGCSRPVRGEAAAGVETESCLKPEKYAPKFSQPNLHWLYIKIHLLYTLASCIRAIMWTSVMSCSL